MQAFLVLAVIIICICPLIHSQSTGNAGTCKTPNMSNGICQPIRECKSLYALLQSTPLLKHNKDYLTKSQCGYQNKQVLVCCPDSIKSLPQPGTCGVSILDKIIGGTNTSIDEYPWMALLQYSKPNNKFGFHCGGVLIHERYVLTASHCVNGKDLPTTWTLFSVRLGEWDLSTETDCQILENNEQDCADPAVDIRVIEKFTHENYDPLSTNKENDIALLKLEHLVVFSDFIKPICLPVKDYLRNFNFDGVAFEIAGWGKTDTTQRSNIKLKAHVNGVGINRCYQIYGAEGIILGNKQMCAGGEFGIDSCRGDSGGPLMTIDVNDIRSYWYLAGVISFGPSPCGQQNWPGVYTRVGSFIEWIESKIN